MRTSQLSLAIFAFLATASPIAKPELGEINAASALSTEPALSKRIIQGLISAGLVTINGKVATPGSQFSPGVYIEKLPEVPICDVSCLDARKTPRDSTCSKKGCTKVSFVFSLSSPLVSFIPCSIFHFQEDLLPKERISA